MNKSSLDRGFGRCVVLRKYGATLKKYKNRTTDRVVRPTLDANKQVVLNFHFPFQISDNVQRGFRLPDTTIYVPSSAVSVLHCTSHMRHKVEFHDTTKAQCPSIFICCVGWCWH